MVLKTGSEFNTAVIDLATGLVLLILTSGLLNKNWKEKTLRQGWLLVLVLLSVGNILGFVAHAFLWSETAFDVIWIFIYPFMYFAAAFFALHALSYVTKGRLPSRLFSAAALSVTAVLCVTSSVAAFFTANDIRIFVVYAALIDLPAFAALCVSGIARKWKSGLYVLLATVPQLIGLPFQLIRKGRIFLFIELDHNGIYHLCLFVSVIMLFLAARADIETAFAITEDKNMVGNEAGE